MAAPILQHNFVNKNLTLLKMGYANNDYENIFEDNSSMDNDNNTGSDYSLSDIDDALDNGGVRSRRNTNAGKQVTRPRRKPLIFPSSVEIPVTVKHRITPSLYERLHFEDSNYIFSPEKSYDDFKRSSVKMAKKSLTLPNNSSGTNTCGKTNLERYPATSSRWNRRRSSKFSINKQTAKYGVSQIIHLFENVPNSNIAETKKINRKSVDLSLTSLALLSKVQNRNGIHTPVLNPKTSMPPQTISRVSSFQSTPVHSGDRSRSQTLSYDMIRNRGHTTFAPSPTPRSRCSSLLSNPSLKTDTDEDSVVGYADTCTSDTVKQWKHYKRAMEAYRMSAKRATSKENGSQSKTLDSRNDQSIFERASIYAVWDKPTSLSFKDQENRTTNSEYSPSEVCSDFSSKHSDDTSSISNERRSTPIKKWYDKEDNMDNLCLDYRSLLRRSPSKSKTQWSFLRRSIKRGNSSYSSNSVRKSIETDTITDIDIMIGANDQTDSNYVEPMTSFGMVGSDSQHAKNNVVQRDAKKSPEKLIWDGYEKYLKSKSEKTKIDPKASLKKRLAVLDQTGKRSRNNGHNRLTSQLSGSSIGSNTSDATEYEGSLIDLSNNINLRENDIIRKRNISMSNSTLSSSHSSKNLNNPRPQRHMPLPYRPYHTVASPARLSKLLRKNKENRARSSVSTPLTVSLKTESLKFTCPDKRTSSLGEDFSNPDFDSKYLKVCDDFTYNEDVFALPSPIPRDLLNGLEQGASFAFPSPPPEFSSPLHSNNVKTSPVKKHSWLFDNVEKRSASPVQKRHILPPCVDELYENSAVTPKILVTPQTPDTKNKVKSSFLHGTNGGDKSNANNQTSLQAAMCIANGELYENCERNQIKLDNRDELFDSDDDYVSYDSFYSQTPPLPKRNTVTPKKCRSTFQGDGLIIDTTKTNSKNTSQFSMLNRANTFSNINQPSPMKHKQNGLNQSYSSKFRNSTKGMPANSTSAKALVINANTNNSAMKMRSNSLWTLKKRAAKQDTESSSRCSSGTSSLSSYATLSPYGTPICDRRKFFENDGSESKNTTLRKGRKKKQVLEISVPLTDRMQNPTAEFQLNIDKIFTMKDESLELMSSFINNESIQKVGKIREMFESKEKLPKMSMSDTFLFNMSKVLKRSRSKVQHLGQNHPPSNTPSNTPSYNTASRPSVNHTVIDNKQPPKVDNKKDKKKGKNKKKKLSKTDIGSPSGFQHVGHVGWDPNKGFDMNNMDPDVKDLFANAGITEKDMEDKEKAQFIYDFIEKQGGIEAVKKDRSTRAPPPPPPSRGGRGSLPPPPPSRSNNHPPPPQSRRHDNNRRDGPPPPPQRQSGGVPPPPPQNQHKPRPQQQFQPPPPPSGSIPSPPSFSSIPPPPMKLGGGGALPPPPSQPASGGGRGALLSQIHKGAKLKSSGDRPNNPPPSNKGGGGGGGRGALLDAIRKGAALNKVSQDQVEKQAPPEEEEDGLAGALARALHNRAKDIHTDSESSDAEDSEDEWSD